jgi:hypothetical protein
MILLAFRHGLLAVKLCDLRFINHFKACWTKERNHAVIVAKS